MKLIVLNLIIIISLLMLILSTWWLKGNNAAHQQKPSKYYNGKYHTSFYDRIINSIKQINLFWEWILNFIASHNTPPIKLYDAALSFLTHSPHFKREWIPLIFILFRMMMGNDKPCGTFVCPWAGEVVNNILGISNHRIIISKSTTYIKYTPLRRF